MNNIYVVQLFTCAIHTENTIFNILDCLRLLAHFICQIFRQIRRYSLILFKKKSGFIVVGLVVVVVSLFVCLSVFVVFFIFFVFFFVRNYFP